MATQGIRSIVDKNGNTVYKIIVGCSGNKETVDRVINKLKEQETLDISKVYAIALLNKLGCRDCLIVMDKSELLYKGRDCDSDFSLYFTTFNNPVFNPRWKYGTVDTIEIIHI